MPEVKVKREPKIGLSFPRVLQCMGMRSETRIFKRERMIIFLVEVASELVVLLSRMPM